jgi:glycosyltransferase involved in cell wall biosynthesis
MHIQFVTYRWGEDLMGGAELHHRRLAQELVEAGHQVSILTTTGHEMRPFCHWGVLWGEEKPAGISQDGEIQVHRFPITRRRKWRKALDAKALEFFLAKEEQNLPHEFFQQLIDSTTNDAPAIYLLHGWHHPEGGGDGESSRWTQQQCFLSIRNNDLSGKRLYLSGYSPKSNLLSLYKENQLVGEMILKARENFSFTADLPEEAEGIYRLECRRVWRPLKEFRALGVNVNSIEIDAGLEQPIAADISEDYRTLGRQVPRQWQEFLLERSKKRAPLPATIFNRLRGPESKGLEKAVRESTADIVIHCNFPWANMSLIRPGDLVMPIWHIEDDFFYWHHWITALKTARFALANTPYTAENFFPELGIDAHFVGPPIWPAESTPTDESIKKMRQRFEVKDEEVLVLTVCRKTPPKRYDAIAQSVQRLHQEGLAIKMIGVGPDGDQRPFDYEGCQWAGPMTGEDLQASYAACDIFAFMSESESFGMVVPEAWHHGKPVVVNQLCGPTASLIENEKDGLLATPGKDLDEKLRQLAQSAELRTKLGENGRVKALDHYTKGAAAQRLLNALK